MNGIGLRSPGGQDLRIPRALTLPDTFFFVFHVRNILTKKNIDAVLVWET